MKLFRTFVKESYENLKKAVANKAKATKKTGKQLCNWFAGCTNPATGTTPHPILGPVHTCNKCHKFATGETRSIKEEVVNELSKKKLGNYIRSAVVDATYHSNEAGAETKRGKPSESGREHDKKMLKREKGIDQAVSKLTKESYTNDSAMAHELIQHADNDADLHRQSHQPIVANLKKKVKKGVYDSGKATKLWGYHADRAAQSYNKKNGDKYSPAWHKQFTPAVRKIAAAHWETHHRDELKEAFTPEELNLVESDELNQIYEGFEDHTRYTPKEAMKSIYKTVDKPWERKVGKKVPYKKKEKPFRDAAVTGKARDFKNEEVTSEAKKLKDTVGFLSPETHAKYAKEKKTIKQFASAKREINRLKRQGK